MGAIVHVGVSGLPEFRSVQVAWPLRLAKHSRPVVTCHFAIGPVVVALPEHHSSSAGGWWLVPDMRGRSATGQKNDDDDWYVVLMYAVVFAILQFAVHQQKPSCAVDATRHHRAY